MFSLPERIVRRLDTAHLDYWDAREERVSSTRVSKDNVRESIATSSRGGFSIRVLRNGQWRSAAFQSLDRLKASDLTFLEFDATGKTEIEVMKPWKFDRTFRVKANPEDIGVEERTALVRATFSKVKKLSTAVTNAVVTLADSLEEKSFVNCEGSSLRYKAPVVRISLQAFAREGSNLQWDFETSGAFGVGFEFAEREFEGAEEIAKGAVEMLNAVRAPLGKMPTVLGPDVAGTLAHESFGHGLEADQVLRERSYLAPLLGKKVAGDSVRIVENPAYPNGFGTYPFDDEGIKSAKSVLVDEGMLKSFIHSRETASHFGVKPTGNGRAEGFDKRIFVRMGNTYFEPGDWELEEMIREVRRGVFLDKAQSGIEDPLGGNLQLIAHGGYMIEKGELTERVRSAALSGKVLRLLKSVSAEGKDFKLAAGFCGKGQEDLVRNSVGGVPVLLKEAIVGGG